MRRWQPLATVVFFAAGACAVTTETGDAAKARGDATAGRRRPPTLLALETLLGMQNPPPDTLADGGDAYAIKLIDAVWNHPQLTGPHGSDSVVQAIWLRHEGTRHRDEPMRSLGWKRRAGSHSRRMHVEAAHLDQSWKTLRDDLAGLGHVASALAEMALGQKVLGIGERGRLPRNMPEAAYAWLQVVDVLHWDQRYPSRWIRLRDAHTQAARTLCGERERTSAQQQPTSWTNATYPAA